MHRNYYIVVMNQFCEMADRQGRVIKLQKQPFKGVLRKRCSEIMQQICRRTPMPKRDFNEVAKKMHTFRTPLPKNTSGGLFLKLTFNWDHYYMF